MTKETQTNNKTTLMCPKCYSDKIDQYRMMTGAIWCSHCGYREPEKEKYNPFIVPCDKKLKREETQAWIKELENGFRYKNHEDGDLIEYGQNDVNILYRSPNDFVTIGERSYTIEQLEALLSHMKQYSKAKE